MMNKIKTIRFKDTEKYLQLKEKVNFLNEIVTKNYNGEKPPIEISVDKIPQDKQWLQTVGVQCKTGAYYSTYNWKNINLIKSELKKIEIEIDFLEKIYSC